MNKRMKMSLLIATLVAAALLLTGCFSAMQPEPTQNPTTEPTTQNTATGMPAATDMIVPTDMPTTSSDILDTTDLPNASDGLEVAPSPSASTAP